MQSFQNIRLFVKNDHESGRAWATFKNGNKVCEVHIDPGMHKDPIKKGSVVRADVVTRQSDKFGEQLVALTIHSVGPAPTFEGSATWTTYLMDRGFGFVTFEDPEEGQVSGFVGKNIIQHAGFIPAEGTEIQIKARFDRQGWQIIGFRQEAEEEAMPDEELAALAEITPADIAAELGSDDETPVNDPDGKIVQLQPVAPATEAVVEEAEPEAEVDAQSSAN